MYIVYCQAVYQFPIIEVSEPIIKVFKDAASATSQFENWCGRCALSVRSRRTFDVHSKPIYSYNKTRTFHFTYNENYLGKMIVGIKEIEGIE